MPKNCTIDECFIGDANPDLLSVGEIPLFSGLPQKDIKRICRCLREKELCQGQVIFSQGDRCRQVIFVRSGRLKISRCSRDGKEHVLEVLHPGRTCACHSGSTEWSCVATATATESCRLWFIAAQDFDRLMRTHTQLAHRLNDLFAKRVRDMSFLLEDMSFKNVQERLIRFLLVTTDSEETNGNGHAPRVTLTREQIAQRIGTTRESVTRSLYRLARSKLIRLEAKDVIIEQRESLEGMVY